MSRVSFASSVNNSTNITNRHSERLFQLQQQMSTGKKIQVASEDPEIASRSQRLSTKIRRNDQLIRNIETNQRFLSEAEDAMRTSIEQLQRIRTLALQSANDTFTTGDTRKIAAEINQQLEGLFNSANSSSLGRTMFAGAETNSPAFQATRDGLGKITNVDYIGDDVELQMELEGKISLTWPGNRVFASGQAVRSSTSNNFDGSNPSSYADRELTANFLPSSGVTEGSLRINGKLINYDLDGNPTSAEGDSLNDLARKINEAQVGVEASVTGVMEGTASFGLPAAAFSTLGGFTAGTFSLNGREITATNNDTVFTLADKINVTSSASGVSASLVDANGNVIDGTPSAETATAPIRLRLSGGVEINDNFAGATNIMQIAGITSSPPQDSGRNLVGNVTENYRLSIQNSQPGPFTIEDASGSLAADLGLTSAGAVQGGSTIFDTLIQLRDALERGDTSSIRSTSLESIDLGLASLEITRTEAGVRTNRFEMQKARLESININTKKVLSDVEDVDLAAVITELNMERTAQNAALRATANILNLSLLNLL